MAIRITRVYTRTGDKGETSLVGGKRVPKDSPRIDAYGTIDELNSIIGLARVFNEENLDAGEAHHFLDEVLCKIQDELFDLGSELATPPEFFQEGMFRISQTEIKNIEKLIDKCQENLRAAQVFHSSRRRACWRLSASMPDRMPASGTRDSAACHARRRSANGR